MNFTIEPTFAAKIWPRATEFGQVTRVTACFLGQPRPISQGGGDPTQCPQFLGPPTCANQFCKCDKTWWEENFAGSICAPPALAKNVATQTLMRDLFAVANLFVNLCSIPIIRIEMLNSQESRWMQVSISGNDLLGTNCWNLKRKQKWKKAKLKHKKVNRRSYWQRNKQRSTDCMVWARIERMNNERIGRSLIKATHANWR